MTSRRYNHTATLLPDGKVLIAGGWNGSEPTATAEIYDPVTRTFLPTGSMNFARILHTATLLNDGTVLIAGGDASGGLKLASAELYNPASGTFTLVGNMNYARESFTATLLADGGVLVAGGHDNSMMLSTTELYNPVTGTFIESGSMLKNRYQHAAALLNNGKVLLVGGVNANPPSCANCLFPLADAELYDPATGSCSVTGSMQYARYLFTADSLGNGNVLIAGGLGTPEMGVLSSAELYDPVAGHFIVTGNLLGGRFFHRTTLLETGHLLLIGGDNGPSYPGPSTLSSVESYDPVTEAFSDAGSMNSKRDGHTATRLAIGQVLITGGSIDSGGTILDSAELF